MKRNFQRIYRCVVGIIVIMTLLLGILNKLSWDKVAMVDTIVGFTAYALDGLIDSIKSRK